MRMFDMANDSKSFCTAEQLQKTGAQAFGSSWIEPSRNKWVPLYEAKMIHQYDHRWATYEENNSSSRDLTDAEKRDSTYEPLSRYWVSRSEVEERLSQKGWSKDWLIGWRDITSAHLLRSVIATTVPKAACGDTFLLMFPGVDDTRLDAALVANKIGGTHLKYNVFKQLPVLPPQTYHDRDLDFITPRVLELTYTSMSMGNFSKDLGYNGSPFTWSKNDELC